MRKLEILLGNSTELLFQKSILKIKEYIDDDKFNNIVIVPDALSLITEKKIFEILEIDTYFNLSVMGISKFINLILKENGLSVMHCSNFESKLLTLKAIQNSQENFKCFSKNFSLGFADEMYAKIEQIKSSNVNIEDLIDDNASVGTLLKFNNIKLIYQTYENLRGERLDSGALLTVFNNVSEDSEYLKTCNVFFMRFDSMTKQGLLLLENVVKFSNYAQISITQPNEQNNYRIYDGTFFQETVNMCKQNNFELNINRENVKFENENKNLILNNLFSRKNKLNILNDYYLITKTNSYSEEIDILVKQINYVIKSQNVKFNKIAICAEQSSHNIIKSKLNNLGIEVYCDNKSKLFDLEPIKLIFNILKYLESKKSKYLTNIICNDFINIDFSRKCELINIFKQYTNVFNIKKLVNLTDQQIIAFLNWVDKLEISTTEKSEYYIDYIKSLIKNLNLIEKINIKIDTLKDMGEIALEKTYRQIEDKFNDLIECIFKNLNEQNLELKEFNKIFEYALKNTEILSVPSGVNEVFIGDTKSFYIDYDYVFVIGMNEGIVPIVLKDYGLITDKEILSETIKAKLEPTTKMINKRNKFKLFEIILSANKKCFMSYHVFDSLNNAVQCNEFISELNYLFNNKTLQTIDYKMENDHKVDQEKILFNCQNYYNANLLLNESFDKKYKDVIKLALAEDDKIIYKPILKKVNVDYSKLFFKDNKVSVSIVEKFNVCPKLAFLANGLKLQPQKIDKVQPNILGTFIHNIGQKFVNINLNQLGKIEESKIENYVSTIVDEVLKDEIFYSLLLPENKFLLAQLKNECVRFCKFLNFEQSVSNFKPVYTEKYFGKNSEFKPVDIETENGKYFITGIVDRIDQSDENFRIIDYKTGSQDNSSGANHLYYGTKIQLFVYAKAIKNNLNKNLFGAFYLPIKNSFNSLGEESYAFSGFFENDAFLVMNCDNRLNLENSKSKLLNVSLKKSKNGEIEVKDKVNILTKEELREYCEYSLNLIKQTVVDIENGFIEYSPLKDKCSICEFSKVCKHSTNKNIEREQKFTIKKSVFENINKNTKVN